MWYVCVCKLTNLCLPIVYFMCMIFGEGVVQNRMFLIIVEGGFPSVLVT